MWEDRPTTEKCGLRHSTTLAIGITGPAYNIGRTWEHGGTSNSSGGGVAGREKGLKIGRKGPCDTGKALPHTAQASLDPSSRMPSGHWLVKVLMRLARIDNRSYYSFANRVRVPYASTNVPYVEIDRPQNLRHDNRTVMCRDRVEDVPRHPPSIGACGKGGTWGSDLSYQLLACSIDNRPS